MISDEDLQDFIATPPGPVVEYHRGDLANDRIKSKDPSHDREAARISHIAGTIMALGEEGHLHLTQRRHGPMDYAYLMQRATPWHF